MVFIKTDENDFIIAEIYGYGELSEIEKEQAGEGYIVESIPMGAQKLGMDGKIKYTVNGGFEIVYLSRPLSSEEEIEQLKQLVADLTELVLMGGN